MKRPFFLPPLLLFAAVACGPQSQQEQVAESRPAGNIPQEETVKDTTPVDTFHSRFPPIDYDTTHWTEIRRLDTSIRLDLRYATTNNFVGMVMYDCARCFLRPKVARAVVRVHRQLRERGLGLKIYDGYRPLPVQWQLWEHTSDRRYVADPNKGSMHNRGSAVDLTIVDHTGTPLPMGTAYDYFGREAHHTYRDLPESVLRHRRLLKSLMEANGFRSIRTEWWHYSYREKAYKIAEWEWPCPEEE